MLQTPKVQKIIDHKIILNSFNSFIGLFRIEYTTAKKNKTITHIAWITASSLLISSSDEGNSWSMVRDYLRKNYVESEDLTRYHNRLFRFFKTSSDSKAARQNINKSNLLSIEFDVSTNELVMVSVTGRRVTKPDHRVTELQSHFSVNIS